MVKAGEEFLTDIFQRLRDHFGALHWWPADSPFEVVIGAILTQNTAWRNVEKAIAALKGAIPLEPADLAGMDRRQLEGLIRPSGFFRQKAERLQLLATHILNLCQGDLDVFLAGPLAEVRQRLLRCKGVGPETADSILLYAGRRPTFVVDAYTRRLFFRLGLLWNDENYEEVRALFMKHLPRDSELFNEYHALIVEQCKRYCRVRPACIPCPLKDRCRALRSGDFI